MTDGPSDPDKPKAKVLIFPASSPRAKPGSFANLGASDLSRHLGAPARQGTGHWCSRCRGIWFGYPLEVACPRCGNRQG